MTISPGWPVAIALALLLAVALGAHLIAGYRLTRSAFVAAARALVQLAVVALLIRAAVAHLWLSWILVLVMFAVGVFTTSRRIEALPAWPWSAFAMACGVVPVLIVVLASQAVPFEGIAIIPVAGIIVGNAMTANTLAGRRMFAALREEHAQYEAALSLGMRPALAIAESVHRRAPEALLPGMDQVSTTGLVTLPGAFIGVMLGGGTPVQAATTQALVLFGIMAAQTITVLVDERLVCARRLVPADLKVSLID
ncbi:MAG: ABC transporter permease [Nocardioidaceae bacterium]|nr:ABC transporter permease [Nocardioidaceae bacterium]